MPMTLPVSLDEKQAALYLGVSVKSLQERRRLGKPPVFYRVGVRRIVYRPADLDKMMQRVEPREGADNG